MILKLADEVHIDTDRDVVWSNVVNLKGIKLLRMEMSREVMEDRLNVRWADRNAVEAKFRDVREQFLGEAAASVARGEDILRIYTR